AKLLRPKEAVGFLRASDSAMNAVGFKVQIVALAAAYGETADFGAMASTLERGRKLFPGYLAYTGTELIAFAGLRRPAAALAVADTLLVGISGVETSPLVFVNGGAEEFRARGDDATAKLLARKVTSWDAAHPGPPRRARDVAV